MLPPPLAEFPYPGKAGAKSQVFLRAGKTQIRNRNKSGTTGKTDGAGSPVCASPGPEPPQGTDPDKAGGAHAPGLQ